MAVAGAGNLVLRVGAIGAGLLGGLALVLAMVGLYGVIADLVLRRTREIGLRMAIRCRCPPGDADGARR